MASYAKALGHFLLRQAPMFTQTLPLPTTSGWLQSNLAAFDNAIAPRNRLAQMLMFGAMPAAGGAMSGTMPEQDVAGQIYDAIQNSGFRAHGIRIDDVPYEAGSILPPSRVWNDGTPTEDVLNGTSSIKIPDKADIGQIRMTLQKLQPYLGQHTILLGSHFPEYGEDADELILGRAQSLGSWPRPDETIPQWMKAPDGN